MAELTQSIIEIVKRAAARRRKIRTGTVSLTSNEAKRKRRALGFSRLNSRQQRRQFRIHPGLARLTSEELENIDFDKGLQSTRRQMNAAFAKRAEVRRIAAKIARDLATKARLQAAKLKSQLEAKRATQTPMALISRDIGSQSRFVQLAERPFGQGLKRQEELGTIEDGLARTDGVRTRTDISNLRAQKSKTLSEKEKGQIQRLEETASRITAIEESRKSLGIEKGITNIQSFSRFITGGGTDLEKQRSIPGRIGESAVAGVIGAPFFIADIATRVPESILKTSALGAGLIIPTTRQEAKKEAIRSGAIAIETMATSVPEAIGFGLSGAIGGTVIPKVIEAKKIKTFERKTEIPQEQQVPFVLEVTQDTRPSEIFPPETPITIGKDVQVKFRKEFKEVLPKPATKLPQPTKARQVKLSDVKREPQPQPTFELITESGARISQVRPTQQTRFILAELEKPSIEERIISIKKQIPKKEIRRTALERFLKTEEGKIFVVTDPLSAVLISAKPQLEILGRGAARSIEGIGRAIEERGIRTRTPLGIIVTKPSVDFFTSNLPKSALDISTEQAVIPDIIQVSDVISDQTTEQETVQAQAQETVQAQITDQISLQESLQEQILLQESVQRTRTKTKQKTKRIRKFTTTAIIADEESQTQQVVFGKEKVKGFHGEILHKGQVKRVTKEPVPYPKAFNKAGKIVDEFVDRSMRVVPTNTLVDKSREKINQALARKFRLSRRNPDFFVEKSKFAIDSRREKQGIPYKAARLRRQGALAPKATVRWF